MGFGKSTLLKKIFEDRVTKGDYVRVFDITGEFCDLARKYGGKIVKLDGSEGRINPLQILKTDESDSISVSNHKSKLHTTYGYFQGKATVEEKNKFEDIAHDMYVERGIIPMSGQSYEGFNCTGLPTKAYPTFSDMLEYIEKTMKLLHQKLIKAEKAPDIEQEIILYHKVQNTISNIVKNYGNIFDGPSTIEKFSAEQVVIFDLSSSKDFKEEIFDAVTCNSLSLVWNDAVSNGMYYKNLFDQRKISLEDVIHTLIIFDEAHHLINVRKTQALYMISSYLKEGRKWFAGLILATPSIRSYIPEGSGENIDAIKSLFDLSQYKFIFHQDSNTLPIFEQAFMNEMTPKEIRRIPELSEGECLLVISGYRNIELKVWVTEDELRLYGGGA